jgi:hypothetical protein
MSTKNNVQPKNNEPVERKRGRPPLNKVNETKKSEVIKTKTKFRKDSNEEELILHLPVFDDSSDTKNMYTIKDETENDDSDLKNNFTTNDEENDITKLLQEIAKRDEIIKGLQNNLKNFKNICQENILTITKDAKKTLINLGLINLETNKLVIADKTKVACWHCTYNFDTAPLFLPEKYHNNKYYVFGNFCSWSCMLGYNNHIDEYRKQIRLSLIKKLYREIYGVECTIKPAGPKEVLEKFGGPIPIDKYRDSKFNQTITTKLTIPPQIPLLSYYEETIIDNN